MNSKWEVFSHVWEEQREQCAGSLVTKGTGVVYDKGESKREATGHRKGHIKDVGLYPE